MKRLAAIGLTLLLTASNAGAETVLGYNLSTGELENNLGSFSTAFASTTDLAAINGQLWGFAEAPVPPVPLPAGVWLLLSALGGLGLTGWRQYAFTGRGQIGIRKSK